MYVCVRTCVRVRAFNFTAGSQEGAQLRRGSPRMVRPTRLAAAAI